MADENQPQQPAGDDKPAEGAPETPEQPSAKPPEPSGEEAGPAPPSAKPAADKPAGAGSAEKPAPASKAPPAKAPASKSAAAKKPAVKKAAKKPVVMETAPWDDELAKELKQEFGERILECVVYLGQQFLVARPKAVIPIIEYLKLEAGFDYLVDVTAVDYPKKEERFEVVYILYSFSRNHRIRVKSKIKDGETLKSAVGVHLTANWLEREVYDMFGIEFEDHPDLKRILMPEDWEGFPLRKDADIIAMDERWVRENIGIDSAQ